MKGEIGGGQETIHKNLLQEGEMKKRRGMEGEKGKRREEGKLSKINQFHGGEKVESLRCGYWKSANQKDRGGVYAVRISYRIVPQ